MVKKKANIVVDFRNQDSHIKLICREISNIESEGAINHQKLICYENYEILNNLETIETAHEIEREGIKKVKNVKVEIHEDFCFIDIDY